MVDHDEQLVDELLVLECQDGNVKAMDLLVARWQKRLWRYAYRLTGSVEGAWEVTQESWLGIVRGISRLNDPARFGAWAYRITTNKSRDWIARSAKTRKASGGYVSDGPETSEPHHGQVRDELQAMMSRLPEQSRTVLTLHYLEGFGVADIAAILRVPQGTVKSRLSKARNELKALWVQESESRRQP
jgi:RNA polymerase sigma-70 factor (ECF subfamily)